MQKLVVEWEHGLYDDYEHYVWAVEYESAEAFLVKFEELCKQRREEHEDYLKLSHQEQTEIHSKPGFDGLFGFEIGGRYFRPYTFYETAFVDHTLKGSKLYAPSNYKMKFFPPRVMELEEWWQQNIQDA